MTKKSKKIVALILAAGESSRLGQAKQNLPFKGSTLLNHIKEHLSLNFVDRTFIVLGAYRKEIIEVSNLSSSEVIEFEDWEEGMGGSLSFACSEIFRKENYDGILITLSDLPLLNKSDYQKMIDLFESKSDIVVTKANGSLGVPAMFGSGYFEDLMALKGKKGAKSIIAKNIQNVKVFENERAGFDIDTLKDFDKLNT